MLKRDAKKESAFERKLKEIEREKRRVQQEIKSLSRALKKGDLPPPASATRVPMREKLLADAPPEGASRTQEAEAGELFAWSKDNDPAKSEEAEEKPALGSPLMAEKKKPVYGDERFGNYFSAGGFKSPMPGRQERSIQRNKAIFMVVLVIVVGYIIVTVLIR